jgi:hypothetical protein
MELQLRIEKQRSDNTTDHTRSWRVGPLAPQILCVCVCVCVCLSVTPFGGMQSDVDGINYCLRISGVAGHESIHQVLVTH